MAALCRLFKRIHYVRATNRILHPLMFSPSCSRLLPRSLFPVLRKKREAHRRYPDQTNQATSTAPFCGRWALLWAPLDIFELSKAGLSCPVKQTDLGCLCFTVTCESRGYLTLFQPPRGQPGILRRITKASFIWWLIMGCVTRSQW